MLYIRKFEIIMARMMILQSPTEVILTGSLSFILCTEVVSIFLVLISSFIRLYSTEVCITCERPVRKTRIKYRLLYGVHTCTFLGAFSDSRGYLFNASSFVHYHNAFKANPPWLVSMLDFANQSYLIPIHLS